ncbi:MAG: glycosyltransferase family 9 protein [Planctomycetaceae bacterium]
MTAVGPGFPDATLTPRWPAPRRIVVIKPSALGDVAQSLPLARVLRTLYPGVELAWVINRELAGLLEGHPCGLTPLHFDRRAGLRAYWKLLKQLRAGRFDWVIDLQGLLRTGVLTGLSGAGLRIGLQTAREGSGWTCNQTVPGTARSVPAFERVRRLAEWLGWQGAWPRLELGLTAGEHDWVADLIGGLPRPLVAVHAGAGWETKRWPAPQFGRAVRKRAGAVIAVGSRAEQPLAQQVLAEVAAVGKPTVNLAGATSLLQLAAVLERVDLVVSNDSGPLHLAAGLRTPLVGVYTCTSPSQSGPEPEAPAELVATQVACAASYRKRCPHRGDGHLACLSELSVSRVAAAVEQVLSRRGVPPLEG